MNQDEFLAKVLMQYQKGLLTLEEYEQELIEVGIKNGIGINEGIAR